MCISTIRTCVTSLEETLMQRFQAPPANPGWTHSRSRLPPSSRGWNTGSFETSGAKDTAEPEFSCIPFFPFYAVFSESRCPFPPFQRKDLPVSVVERPGFCLTIGASSRCLLLRVSCFPLPCSTYYCILRCWCYFFYDCNMTAAMPTIVRTISSMTTASAIMSA